MSNSCQVILEIRFNRSLKFNDNNFINNIISILDQYGYVANRMGQNIDAINQSSSIHVSINPVRCGIDYNTKDIESNEFNENIKPLIDVYKLLSINYVNRIGLRIISSSGYNTIDIASHKVKDVVEIKNEQLEELKSKCDIFTMSFHEKMDDCDVKTSIIPKQINVNVSGFDSQINILSLDIDVSKNNVSIDNHLNIECNNFFNKIVKLNSKFEDIF